MNENLILCLRLIRTHRIGCLGYRTLIKEHGNEKAALDFLSQRKIKIFSEKAAIAEIKAHHKIGATLLSYYDDFYPPLLKQIHDFPPVISVLGNQESLISPSIAIVGSRTASAHAINFTHDLSQQTTESGYTVISGLARGIDTAAHKGALNHCTIAVVAGGIDHIYPQENAALREKIIEKGAVISEMPLGLFPGASHFPRRNRLISGLSKAVCIMEAAKPSGSLITASYTLDQGRELFVMPGFPGDARCRGTNHLIKEGAHVLESIDDVLSIIGPASVTSSSENSCPSIYTPTDKKKPSFKRKNPKNNSSVNLDDTQNNGNAEHIKIDTNKNNDNEPSDFHLLSLKERVHHKILEQLSTYPLSFDELINRIEEKYDVVHETILALELSGDIHRDNRGYIARVFNK